MPSRSLLSSPVTPPAAAAHRRRAFLVVAFASASASSLLLLALVLLFFCLCHRLRRSPSSAPNSVRLRRFSYRALHSATDSFDPSLTLGRGASAAVFRGLLPDGKAVAVKRLLLPEESMSSLPLHSSFSDREFHNELQVLAALPPSPLVVSLLGYCIEGKRRRLLVYEYMPNGSLQEALFGSRLPPAALTWERRFAIILDVAGALAFLHLECDPAVVHGDIKPSNVLLGVDFRAKISDFGLSRGKTDADRCPEFFSQDLPKSEDHLASESPKVEFAFPLHGASSSGSCKNFDARINPNISTSPKDKKEAIAAAAASDEPLDDNFSIEHSMEFSKNSLLEDGRLESNGASERKWWWKQEECVELSSRDYVKEWIGNQVCPPSNPDWEDGRKISSERCFEFRNLSRVESLDAIDDTLFGDAINGKRLENQRKRKCIAAGDKKDRKMREWWKEEYFAEISKKSDHLKKETKWFRTISSPVEECSSNALDKDNKLGRDLSTNISLRKGWKKRSRSADSEIFSGDLFSRELSSTTSMRGTVCYVAPECHVGEHLMEKADIYSFGVLILVIVSGRRPLHLQSSPVKLENANLVTWCRQLAHTGNILELVDERLKDSYSKDQVNLCINLALLCLQRAPELRPDIGNIVKILRGEMELPVLPCESSPSPPARHFSRSQRKGTTKKN